MRMKTFGAILCLVLISAANSQFCPFVSSDPPDSIYWIRTRDGELEKVGDCGDNKRFDDFMCECLEFAASGGPFDCKTAKVDLMFIVDQSGSIREDRWRSVTDFICKLTEAFDVAPRKTQIALVVFKKKCRLRFNFRQHYNNEDVCKAVHAIEFEKGSTNIACGLKKARKSFTSTMAGQSPGKSNIAVLITDGTHNKNKEDTLPEAELLKEHATVVSVGITPQVDEELLKAIATKPEFYTFIHNFTMLDTNVDDVKEMIFNATKVMTTTIPSTTTTSQLPPDDPCYRCTDYNDQGFGFIDDPDKSLCHVYWLCKSVGGVNERSVRLECPPGTVYSAGSSINGVPCVHQWEVNTTHCVDNEGKGTIAPQKCPYITVGGDNNKFWSINENGQAILAGDCGIGGSFDMSLCTCMNTVVCRCRLHIRFEDSFEDKSCNQGHVTKEGPVDVYFYRSGYFNLAGAFDGLYSLYNNGAHLKAWSLNGAYSSNCLSGGLYSLSVSLWFRADGPLDRLQGLLTYGDCFDDSPSYYIWLDHDKICAGLNTHGFPNVEICMPEFIYIYPQEWYYVVLTYDMPDLSLRVTTAWDYLLCDHGFPARSCFVGYHAKQYGCVAPRNCGVQIGLTAKAKNPDDNFFRGLIDEVKISDIDTDKDCARSFRI